MPRQKSQKSEKIITNPRDAEIERLRSIPRAERNEGQIARLRDLHQEVARERFVRLAGARARRACKALASLRQCANRNSYVYSPEEAQSIVEAVSAQCADTVAAFTEATDDGKLALSFSWER